MHERCERPGGLALTRRLLGRFSLPAGARVLDMGCGAGATVALLRGQGCRAEGIDLAPPQPAEGIHTGDAARLPFADGTFDVVLFECSLSRMARPEAALAEARRVLAPGGFVLLCDLYAKPSARPVEGGGLLGRVAGLSDQLALCRAAGFAVERTENLDGELASYWAALVFERGPEEALACLGLPAGTEKPGRWGYFSAVLRPAAGDSCERYSDGHAPCLWRWTAERTGLGEALSPESLARRQLERAAETVRAAKANSPFYREHLAGVEPDALFQEGISALPLTDAAMLARQGERMLCIGLGQVERIRTVPTSGSTGPPKRVWFTREEQQRTVDFFAHGMRAIAPAGRPTAILMSDDKPGSIADLLREGLGRIGVEGRIVGRPAGVESARAAIGDAACLVGLPADLLYLCRKLPGLRPETVLLSADYIAPAAIRQLEAAWGCRVFCHYGLTETGYGLAVQCPARQGQHMRPADFLVEILHPETGLPLPPGQPGEVVLTSLQPRALPLVRYRTGDIASLATRACGCGCTLPRLGPVLGRWENLRRPLNIHRLDDILYAIDGLAGYEAVLKDGRLRLTLEGGCPDANALEKAIGHPLTLRFAEAPPWRSNGKKRLVHPE